MFWVSQEDSVNGQRKDPVQPLLEMAETSRVEEGKVRATQTCSGVFWPHYGVSPYHPPSLLPFHILCSNNFSPFCIAKK